MPASSDRVRDITRQGDKLFTDRAPILSLWQTLAENFYPMRADFTRSRYLSEEFASYLMTGRPAMAHRDLSNSFSAFLRPRDDQWFHTRTTSAKINENTTAKAWLDWVSETQRRVMYDRRAQFVRATKEGDKDFCAFGQTVITPEPNYDLNGMLFRCWHLRDCAWAEDSSRVANRIHFQWNPKVYQLQEMFKDVAPKVRDAKNTDRDREVRCRRMIIPVDDYDQDKKISRGKKFVSVYVDLENDWIMEERPTRTMRCVIPRWETVSGSQYAYSPAAIMGLPDARMLQQITLTILEASQKANDPPLIQVGEVINGGTNLYAGGLTSVEADYDERTGEALRPLALNPEGIRYGADREERMEKAIDETWFRNRIGMPTITKEMTAFETAKLYEDFIRGALPLFEPVEVEYNAAICSESFEVCLDMGFFGSPLDMPEMLRGQDVKFDFDTPLKAANEKAKVQYFQQTLQITAEAAQVDPGVALNLDLDRGYRDAIAGSGSPASWLLSEDDVAAARQKKAQADAAKAAADAVAHGADVATRVAGAAKSAGDAATSLQDAGVG